MPRITKAMKMVLGALLVTTPLYAGEIVIKVDGRKAL